MANVLITGNTYPVKDAIKALGGRWDADAKGWRVPESKADAARRLVSGAGTKQSYSSGTRRATPARKSRGTWTGCSCGSVEEYERSGDCSSCRHDRD